MIILRMTVQLILKTIIMVLTKLHTTRSIKKDKKDKE